ncbi:MAG: hypothetical protein NTZ75_08285 [Euryarchaeota archaeon]|nr:hypothetical protein [Euryarchaeota archaeon]
MPEGWVHATIDLIVYGRPYFDIHKNKDEAFLRLGKAHRKIKHEWYQAFGKKWTFDDPFPDFLKGLISEIRGACGSDKAEKQMVYWDHDYFDRIWKNLSEKQRKYCKGAFAWIINNPMFLKNWAGVDVLEGKIKRVIDGQEVWEICPELKSEYHRLHCYVKTVIEYDKDLQDMLKCN